MRILLIGASGQIGRECYDLLRDSGLDFVALSRDQLDFANAQEIKTQLTEIHPDLVINACAYTAVDRAETDSVLAEQVNTIGVAVLASACCALDAALIHLSTDYVFDGTSQLPYPEDAQCCPLGVYGATKYAGEQAVAAAMTRFIILRTSWVFGLHGHNFVKTMLRLGKERQQLKVVNDQWGRPSYAADIAKMIVALVALYQHEKSLPWGIYHCCNSGETNWYDFACAIMEAGCRHGVLSCLPDIQPIPTIDYPTPAPRPAYSVLGTAKLDALLGVMPPWTLSLEEFFVGMSSK